MRRYTEAMATTPKADSVEKAALRLKPRARAKLLQSLAMSLEALPRKEREAIWLDEVERRAAELDSGRVKAIPGEEVFARIRARIKAK